MLYIQREIKTGGLFVIFSSKTEIHACASTNSVHSIDNLLHVGYDHRHQDHPSSFVRGGSPMLTRGRPQSVGVPHES